ncbi:unnamed protein product [Trichogramma brassicae]|uniref:Uncharacterized protein n=1 Tax=Trichogramma brassicae TaxID=86971 RepID=A0A6H5I3Q7_9HYME|nr:unnamed protein product [Trichogramma brassicae]
MSTPNDETAGNFRVVSDEFIDVESDDVDVSSDIEYDDSDAKSQGEDGPDNEIEEAEEYDGSFHGEDGTGDEIRNNHSQEMYTFKRNELKCLKILGQNVNWEIQHELNTFFLQLSHLVKDWKVQLPDLRSIFSQNELDFLLIKAVISNTYSGQEFIQFVVRTGYKDRFDVPEDDKYKPSLLHRTTAIHHAARNEPNDWESMVKDLFKIYDRFDVNYTDELGLTHFHVACMTWNCQDLVRKFLERGQVDPNLIWPETGDSPLHLSVHHERKDSAVILMRNGADPNLANKGGLTPLHMSVRSGIDANTVRTLFKICEDMKQPLQVNAQDNLGNTPLH